MQMLAPLQSEQKLKVSPWDTSQRGAGSVSRWPDLNRLHTISSGVDRREITPPPEEKQGGVK